MEEDQFERPASEDQVWECQGVAVADAIKALTQRIGLIGAWTVAVLIVWTAVVICSVAGISPIHPADSREALLRSTEAAQQKAQADATAYTALAQAKFQERIMALQQRVADLCVTHGGTPVFFNGNVDCKAGSK